MNEELEGHIRRVQQNTCLALEERMKEREHAIITQVVVAYRANKLDIHRLFGAIGAISELRSMSVEAQHEVAVTEEEIDKLTGTLAGNSGNARR